MISNTFIYDLKKLTSTLRNKEKMETLLACYGWQGCDYSMDWERTIDCIINDKDYFVYLAHDQGDMMKCSNSHVIPNTSLFFVDSIRIPLGFFFEETLTLSDLSYFVSKEQETANRLILNRESNSKKTVLTYISNSEYEQFKKWKQIQGDC